MNNKNKVFIVGLVIILIIFYFHTFIWLVESWLTEPDYSHGFLVPIVSVFFIWRNRRVLEYGEKDINTGMLILGIGLFLYVISVLFSYVFISAISLMVVLSGIVVLFYGKVVLREWLFPLCFLIFMIPLPNIELISAYLQVFTADFSTSIAQKFGIGVSNAGNSIYLECGEMFVGEECSGLRIIIPLFALASIFVYMLACSRQIKIFLLIITIPIAAIANVLRVTLTIFITNSHGIDAGATFFHYISGVLFFVISFIILIIIAKFLKCTYHSGKNT